jgi:mono/diheme cytochrome c family protein
VRIIAALVLVACGAGGAQALAADAGEAHPGAAAYSARCAQCHDNAVYKAPAKSFLQFMAPDAIYSALADGIMQTQAAGLTDEKHRVADYLVTPRLPVPRRWPRCCVRGQWTRTSSPPPLWLRR